MVPGRRFSTSTSARCASRRSTSLPRGAFRSRASERLLRFSRTNPDDSPSMNGAMVRTWSPPSGFSILITSAPRSASCSVQNGAAMKLPTSRTRRPARAGSGMRALYPDASRLGAAGRLPAAARDVRPHLDVAVNHARLLIDGHRILPALLEDIAAARRSIHVAMFLFFRDPIGQEIAEALASKVAQGVEVRVLLNLEKTQMGDPFSTGEKRMMKHDPNVHHDPTDVGPLCAYMKKQGIQVVDTNIDYDRVIQARDPRLRSLGAQIRETIAVDDLHVDHRKIVVIDGRVAYCGGANVGAQYLYHRPFDPEIDARVEGDEHKKRGMPEPWWKWHDSLTRFEGPIARELETHFHDRFILDGGEEYALSAPDPQATLSTRGFPVAMPRVFANEPNEVPNAVRELYVRLIREARTSIFLENPYLYHPAIVDALCEAKRLRPSLEITLM